MAKILIDKGIRKIDIEDTEGNITATLYVNTDDTSIPTRYFKVIDSLTDIEKEEEREKKKIDKEDLTETDRIIKLSNIRVATVKKAIAELDSIFGVDAIENVFADCRKINPDYLPTEYTLMSFLEGITPLMQEWFKEHQEKMHKKYGVK